MSLLQAVKENYPKKFSNKKFMLEKELENANITIEELQQLRKENYSYPVILKILRDKKVKVDSTYTIKDLLNNQPKPKK